MEIKAGGEASPTFGNSDNRALSQSKTKMALVVVDKSKSPLDIEAKPGLVGGKYYADKRIGEGSFGVIYKGKDFGVAIVLIVFCL